MQITQLHALARRQLLSLAHARYMPRGFDRHASQQADRKQYELSKYLDAALAQVPDKLMPWPEHATLTNLLALAAQERTLRAMVEKMVGLLNAQPEMDQADAYALADITDRLAAAQRVASKLEDSRKAFESLADHATKLEVDFSAVFAALKDLEVQVGRKVDILEDNQRLLTEAP